MNCLANCSISPFVEELQRHYDLVIEVMIDVVELMAAARYIRSFP
jgi:hypothetical protein